MTQAKFVILASDTTKEAFFVVRLKLPPHYKMKPHHHLNCEYDTIIEGKCYIAMGEKIDQSKRIANTAFSFVVIPPLLPHYGWTENEGTIIQISVKGPWSPISQRTKS